jgi:hypothetical protein
VLQECYKGVTKGGAASGLQHILALRRVNEVEHTEHSKGVYLIMMLMMMVMMMIVTMMMMMIQECYKGAPRVL